MAPLFKNSTNQVPWLSQKILAMNLSAEVYTLNLFFLIFSYTWRALFHLLHICVTRSRITHTINRSRWTFRSHGLSYRDGKWQAILVTQNNDSFLVYSHSYRGLLKTTQIQNISCDVYGERVRFMRAKFYYFSMGIHVKLSAEPRTHNRIRVMAPSAQYEGVRRQRPRKCSQSRHTTNYIQRE